MAIYWLSTLDPDEKGFFSVDWTDEMDASSDTVSGTPTFTFIDSSVYGLRVSGITIATGSKKVNLYIDNSDPATNRVDVLANSPYLITHAITTAAGQTLSRVVGLIVTERGGELTVEDGTVVSGADTYISLEAADLYHVNRGNTDWSGTDAERARAMRRGLQFIEGRFLGRLKGTKSTSGQAPQWPRDNMTDEDGNEVGADTIPQRVKDAQCEAARLVPYTQEVTIPSAIKSLKAGSVAVEFATASEERGILDLVDELMRPYTESDRMLRA